MKATWALLAAHASVLLGGVFSMLVLIPHPEMWQHLPGSGAAYGFAMEHAGPVHILFGAAALLAFGAHVVGWRRTAIFFGISVACSLGFELLGTGTGWPFGAYSYTLGLGWKVGGRVPFSIPLSWFYMGFTSFLLALLAVRRWPSAPRWVAVPLGVWLLMAWDLTLDPAMAHADLPLKFWVWHERGAYLGMPLINLGGWIACGAIFMGGSAAAWRALPDIPATAAPFLFAAYAVNVAFGALLCLGFGMVTPAILGSLAALGPAALVFGVPRSPDDPVLTPLGVGPVGSGG